MSNPADPIPAGPPPAPPPVLNYARKPNRGLWLGVAGIVLAAIVGVLNGWGPRILAGIAEGHQAWQQFGVQTECEALSAADGEVVFRSDGSSYGISHPQAVPARPGLPAYFPYSVARQPPAFGRYCDLAARPPAGTPLRKLLIQSQSNPSLMSNYPGLVDCRRRALPGGGEVLAWVLVLPVQDGAGGIEIMGVTADPGSRFRRGGSPGFAGGSPDRSRLRIASRNPFNSKPLNAVVARQSGPPDVIGLRVVTTFGVQDVAVRWTQGRYVIDAVPLPAFTESVHTSGATAFQPED